MMSGIFHLAANGVLHNNLLHMKICTLWRQLNNTKKDVIKAAVIVLVAFTIDLKVNLAETLAESLEKYEHLQLDEIPFLLLFIAIASAWFASRRMVEKNKEITLRIAAEEKIAKLLVENKSLTLHILKVQEFERLELAQDLHDDIGQYLLAIRLDASALNVQGVDDNPARRILSNANHIQNMAKSLMRRLRPAPTNSNSCVDSIHILVQEWREQMKNTRIDLHIDEHLHLFSDQVIEMDKSLIEQISVVLYRFVQEALTNIAKHAKASRVYISLRLLSVSNGTNLQKLCVEIKDDGKGLGVQMTSTGMGLTGMRERISAVNGEFFIQENIPHGLIVCAKIPINVKLQDG